jgi:hypothetical protein
LDESREDGHPRHLVCSSPAAIPFVTDAAENRRVEETSMNRIALTIFASIALTSPATPDEPMI